jgi:hypothetical protein
MSPIIQWLLSRSQMQKAAIGGMESAYGYRRPAPAPFSKNPPPKLSVPQQFGDAMGSAFARTFPSKPGNSGLDRPASPAWKPPGSTPSMPAPASPEAGRTPFQAGVAQLTGQTPPLSPGLSPMQQIGDAAGTAFAGAFPSKPGNSGLDNLNIAPQTRIADDPTYRAPKEVNRTAQVTWDANQPAVAKPQTPISAQLASTQSAAPAAPAAPVAPAAPSAMHPSEQAKLLREQMNKRQRDAAFGRGTFSPQERQKMMAQHEALIAQSNKMRNAAGYQPDAASTNPRDVADRARIQLNQQRSAAGGEVAQAPQVMQRLNQLGRQYDAVPAQTQAQMPMGVPAANLQNMVAKTSAASSPFMFGAYIGQLSR